MPDRLNGVSQKIAGRVPDWIWRYGIALGSLSALVGITLTLLHFFGRQHPFLYSLVIAVYYLVILLAAWLGYGPGILVCLLTSFVLPELSRRQARNLRGEFLMFGIQIIVALVVSRIAQSRRQREQGLIRTAEELEGRARERTEEALRAGAAALEAEERLRFVLDSASVGYWDFDFHRNASLRSAKLEELFGYREPESGWTLESFLEHVHKDDRSRVRQRVAKLLRGGHDSIEFRIVLPEQCVRWLWAQLQASPGKDGMPSRLTGIVMDITARRESEDHLREQAQLLDLAHDAILSIDWDGTIRFWSEGAARMYGWTRQEALGRTAQELLATRYPELRQNIAARLAGEGYWEGELVHDRRDGVQIRVASRWALRRGAAGEPLGYLEINTDVTERRRIEEQLSHTQKLESLGVLAGGVAHDFNNLLTGILGNASLLLERVPEHHPNRPPLEDLTRAAERAADLTRQLLAYAGKGRFVLRTVDLSGLVREISGLIRTSIPKTVNVRLQLADRLPGIEADAGQIQQIVMNLVINGAEAIGPEGGTVLVSTAAQTVDEPYILTMSSAGELLAPGAYVALEVHDTGSGMSEETISKIFDPFFTTKFAGRGLGLSAVLGIVRAHKGALKVYSQPGQGSTFKVLLPASRNPIADPLPIPASELDGKGIVLVVDDEMLVLQTARHTLERYGYHVLGATDGSKALDVYRENPGKISLVLLDLTMPVMSGEETLRQLQTIDPKVCVLLTSGYNEVEAVERFAGKGLAGFIQKPFTARGLAEKVKELIAGRGRAAC